MTNLDQFESVFKSSDKAVYQYAMPEFRHVLLVTDLDAEHNSRFTKQVRTYLSAVDNDVIQWTTITGDDFGSVKQLLEQIENRKPDLIVTYRHLKSKAWQWPYSLGEYLDVMTQATAVPVMVMPHPHADRTNAHNLINTNHVMAITDHMTGDDQLVNMALTFTNNQGTCWLSHVENQAVFERYMDVISKIPLLNTDAARESIATQLLKEPSDYIAVCQREIQTHLPNLKIKQMVLMGRRIDEYRKLIKDHEIDLLVMHTKSEDHLAMQGAAYPLAVGLRTIPLLLI